MSLWIRTNLMRNSPEIFVSYTTRDGLIDEATLKELRVYLESFGNPFIDKLASTTRFPQLRIFWRLIRSDMFLLIVSPKTFQSPWVKIELSIAQLTRKPILKLLAKTQIT